MLNICKKKNEIFWVWIRHERLKQALDKRLNSERKAAWSLNSGDVHIQETFTTAAFSVANV